MQVGDGNDGGRGGPRLDSCRSDLMRETAAEVLEWGRQRRRGDGGGAAGDGRRLL